MGFWSGLVIGLFLGGIIGVFAMALCVAARNNDKHEDQYYE